MGDLLSRGLSGIGIESFQPSPRAGVPEAGQPPESSDLLSVLRQNLNEGLQPPAAILHATAEAARVLTGADGAALALRTKGVIVCRACSGDPTPDLGSPLNTDSGISGECLRAASILVCNDAESDARVDPDVCSYLGIRSIAVVPLRGPTGISGILEAFSTRAGAFGEPQIDVLRALAEIAEAAYSREVRGLQESPVPPPKAARIRMRSDEASGSDAATGKFDEPSPVRRVWFIGIAVIVMLLAAGVWLSGHEPTLETSAKEPPAELRHPDTPALDPVTIAVLKPRPGIEPSERSPDRSAAETLKRAVRIEVIEDSRPAEAVGDPAGLSSAGPASTPATPANVGPPNVGPPNLNPTNLNPANTDPPGGTGSSPVESTAGDQLSRLAASPTSLPSLDAPVSQGITSGRLIRKVNPVYPAQARTQRLSGTVALEITIAEDGSVSDIRQISGNAMLSTAASAAIRQWRYIPFLLNGKPIEVQKHVTVLFKLPGADSAH
jgi:TonB family protein